MRLIQYWPGQSDTAKLGIYKTNLVKSSNDMKPNQEHHRQIKKPRRYRSAFTTEQINYLEKQYKKFPYINSDHRKKLAVILKLTERTIKIWFQNRRMKEKKESTREFDNETGYYHAQEFGKDLLNNVPAMPSTNDQRLYSLPIISLTLDATPKTNTDTKDTLSKEQSKKFTTVPESVLNLKADPKATNSKPNFYKEAENNEYVSPYFHNQSTNTKTLPFTTNSKNISLAQSSAEFSINLCKKYKQECVPSKSAPCRKDISEGNSTKKSVPERPRKDVHRSTFLDGYPKKMPMLSQPQPEQPKANMNSQAYYSVVPTIYAPPLMSSGGLLWKPVNVMPVMANTAPVTIPGPQGVPAPEQSKNCICNCHGGIQHVPINYPQNIPNPYAQYLITLPYQHTSPKL